MRAAMLSLTLDNMLKQTPPTRHAILCTLLTFGTIVFIGSFSSLSDAVGLATVFVGLPWFVFYFLDWLGGDYVRRMRDDIERRVNEQQ